MTALASGRLARRALVLWVSLEQARRALRDADFERHCDIVVRVADMAILPGPPSWLRARRSAMDHLTHAPRAGGPGTSWARASPPLSAFPPHHPDPGPTAA